MMPSSRPTDTATTRSSTIRVAYALYVVALLVIAVSLILTMTIKGWSFGGFFAIAVIVLFLIGFRENGFLRQPTILRERDEEDL